MTENLETGLRRLVDALAGEKSVRALGLSGGTRPLPEPGQNGDIDIFVYCTEIPSMARREAIYSSLGRVGFDRVEVEKLAGGNWGHGDCTFLSGIETWLMFFTIAETETELADILAGRRLRREDNYFYPIGRCAMWQGMRALYDADGFIGSLQERTRVYPADLQRQMVAYHLGALEDVEDLERAVGRRDVLFFHFALDLALDHFLLALFALNKTYFPSRKRSEEFLRGFAIKPAGCEERLRRVIALGSRGETIEEAYATWQGLVKELDNPV